MNLFLPGSAGSGRRGLHKGDFTGRAALLGADRRPRTSGLQCPGGVARHGGKPADRVCSSAWSPRLQRCIAIARLPDPDPGPARRWMSSAPTVGRMPRRCTNYRCTAAPPTFLVSGARSFPSLPRND